MATTDDKSPVFLDTNILIRFTLATAPLHHEAREAITLLWDSEVELWISRQVIREYAAVLTRPQTYTLPLSSAVVVEQLRIIREQFRVADETADVTTNLLSLMQSVALGGKQVHDANIVATMQAYGVGHLLTLNTADFTRFSPHITVLSLEDVEALLKP